jgi:DNA invertase Pin-like site-specific DNA recombinase
MHRRSSHASAHKAKASDTTIGRSNGRTKSRAKLRAKRNATPNGGTHKGRIAIVDPARIQALKSRGLGASEIATKLKISRSSVYRYA